MSWKLFNDRSIFMRRKNCDAFESVIGQAPEIITERFDSEFRIEIPLTFLTDAISERWEIITNFFIRCFCGWSYHSRGHWLVVSFSLFWIFVSSQFKIYSLSIDFRTAFDIALRVLAYLGATTNYNLFDFNSFSVQTCGSRAHGTFHIFYSRMKEKKTHINAHSKHFKREQKYEGRWRWKSRLQNKWMKHRKNVCTEMARKWKGGGETKSEKLRERARERQRERSEEKKKQRNIFRSIP